MLERNVFLPVGLVMQYRMAVKERAATTVLARQAAVVTLFYEAGIGHRFGEAPVHIDIT